MRQTIEDLEALKDLNDELEENHVDAEKQLNSEIGELNANSYIDVIFISCLDILSAQLRDEKQKSSELDTIIIETETTIAQFRDLVANLQRSVEHPPSPYLLTKTARSKVCAYSKPARSLRPRLRVKKPRRS